MSWILGERLLVGCVVALSVGCAAVKNAQDDDRPGAPPPLAESDGSKPVDVSPGELTPVEPDVPRVPDAIRRRIKDGGRAPFRASAKVKLCVNKEGKIYKVDLVRSTGMVDLDDAVVARLRGWKYRQYLVKAKPTQACTEYLFNFEVL
jgi:hypothetical protein